ncbi:MAG: hypothetical protein ACKVUT_15935 [Gaiella sp.]
MGWPWLLLLACAVVLLAAAESPRISNPFGSSARRARERAKRKASFQVLTNDPDSDEFAASVQRDLDSLPTTKEPNPRR